ncbi:MAG: DNA replication/repair protein RecF [Ignavibacteriaceae bacterium]
MTLKSLALKNFRIYNDTKIDFSPNINYLIGGNGQGKTSLLEAIYFMCTTKNFKSASDAELMRFSGEEYSVEGLFTNITDDSVRIYYSAAENRRTYSLNNKIVSRTSEIIGRFPIVLLTPQDHDITQGTPADRRKFFDSVISQSGSNYLLNLIEYGKILKNRSSLLNTITYSYRNDLLEELDAWDQKLVSVGSLIIIQRRNFIKEFLPFFFDAYKSVTKKDDIPGIKYSFLNNNNSSSDPEPGDIEEKFRALLIQKRDDELKRVMNLVGPHRDEFVFALNNNQLRTFGSQGEHKTFQVALRFAQYFYLKEKLNRTPIILLDDVFGELEAKRASAISDHLQDLGQTFVTLTDFSNFSLFEKKSNNLIINIKDGTANYA